MILFLAIGLVALAILLLSIKIIAKKGGEFPNSHISANKELSKKGISCAISTDAKERKKKDLADKLEENQKI